MQRWMEDCGVVYYMSGKTIQTVYFWLRSDYKNTILVKTGRSRADRAARLTAEAQNLERSGPYVGSFSVILSTQARRDQGFRFNVKLVLNQII